LRPIITKPTVSSREDIGERESREWERESRESIGI
jgi:hypothetical protein